MKKLLTAIGLSLSLVLPASAEKIVKKQPTVPPYSLAAMGCMILLECTEGVEKLTSESELLKAKELEALRSYEQKATDKIAATHLSNLKKAMNTAKNFERLNLKTVSQVLYCAIEKQKQAAELVKKAQRESLWNKSQQLKREQFSNQNLCHAPPTGQQVKKYLSSSKTFIHERVMSGGCSI